MTRHIGRHKETDRQVVLSYMLLPNQTTNALVTYPDDLSETLRRELMAAVSSLDAQKTENFADVIGRRLYADSGKSILQVLHEAKRLIPTSIDEIVMTPDGNHRLELRQVLEAIQRIPTPDATARFNPHTYNTVAEGQAEQIGVARNLLEEAKMLEADAQYKRTQAYQLAPSLRPQPEPVADAPAAPAEVATDENGAG